MDAFSKGEGSQAGEQAGERESGKRVEGGEGEGTKDVQRKILSKRPTQAWPQQHTA